MTERMERMSLSDVLKRLRILEDDVRYQEFADSGEEEFTYVPGKVPVLLSAPHGTVHSRLNESKQEDEYSSGFARLVAEMTSAHVIYTRRRSHTDPNWHPRVPYKQMLRRIIEKGSIRFVLDIHGVAEHRRFGIAIGTMGGTSCPHHKELIIRNFERHGFTQDADALLYRLDIDQAFTAVGLEGQETITRFVWKTFGVPVAQFELHPALRVVERRPDATERQPFFGEPDLIEAAVYAFVALIDEITCPLVSGASIRLP